MKKEVLKSKGFILWRKKEIQRLVEHKARKKAMRISRVNAWNTSRLAYDESGKVKRGEYKQGEQTKRNYSICVFQNGKTYNSDLKVSCNIGARYFIRKLLKSEPAMARLPDDAKVHHYSNLTFR